MLNIFVEKYVYLNSIFAYTVLPNYRRTLQADTCLQNCVCVCVLPNFFRIHDAKIM
jgi:hypothetical protein